MSRQAALLRRGRRAAARLMSDTCRITRPIGGRGALNPATGKYPERGTEVVYEGPCRVQVRTADARETDAGERSVGTQQLELHLPVEGTSAVTVDDVAEILTAPFDDALVGRVLTVTARHDKSQATARRLPVREGTS